MAHLVKTDIFKGLMFFAYDRDHGRGKLYALDKERVKEFVEMNKRGEYPVSLAAEQVITTPVDDEPSFDDAVTGVIELPPDKRKKKKKNKPRGGGQGKTGGSANNRPAAGPNPRSGPGGNRRKGGKPSKGNNRPDKPNN